MIKITSQSMSELTEQQKKNRIAPLITVAISDKAGNIYKDDLIGRQYRGLCPICLKQIFKAVDGKVDGDIDDKISKVVKYKNGILLRICRIHPAPLERYWP